MALPKNNLFFKGDDFTYDGMEYANKMFGNHQKIHDELNADSNSHVNIKFSNLSNYFDSVAKSADLHSTSFPILKGDFFTYADREQDYWYPFFQNVTYKKSHL